MMTAESMLSKHPVFTITAALFFLFNIFIYLLLCCDESNAGNRKITEFGKPHDILF